MNNMNEDDKNLLYLIVISDKEDVREIIRENQSVINDKNFSNDNHQ